MTRRWPVFGVAQAVLWLFVRGVPVDPVSGTEDLVRDVLGEFLIGLAVGVPIAYTFRRMYAPEIDLRRLAVAVGPALAYLVTFVVELVTANVDVAYRVLSPSMPIDPEMIELPLRVESDLAIATIANSITMTPGTLTLDYDEERNALYIHAIYCDDPAAVAEPIRTWEDYALRIFDESATPETAASEPHVYDPDTEADVAADVDTAAVEHGGDAGGE
jgi:multicomponent Na+:H+ antiporter subunit E